MRDGGREAFYHAERDIDRGGEIVPLRSFLSERTRSLGIRVDQDGRVDAAAYAGGSEDLARVQQKIHERNGESWETYRRNARLSEGGRGEVAFDTVLSRFSGDTFTIVRTAHPDDYEKGIDMFIVDRSRHGSSGNIVAAVDILVSASGDDIRKRRKLENARKQNENGVTLRYGVEVLESGEYRKAERRGLPVLVFSITPGDTQKALHQVLRLKDLGADPLTPWERAFLAGKVIPEIDTQLRDLLKLENRGHFAISVLEGAARFAQTLSSLARERFTSPKNELESDKEALFSKWEVLAKETLAFCAKWPEMEKLPVSRRARRVSIEGGPRAQKPSGRTLEYKKQKR